MKKIKNFFAGIISIGITAALIDNFKVLVTVLLVLAVLFVIFRLAWRIGTHLGRVADKKNNPQSEQKTKISVSCESHAKVPVHFSSSTDKEDYDYAYSHVGLFRPQNTPAPIPPIGTDVFFQEEPDNPYDADAIKAVWSYEGNELLVGYFYRSDDKIREMVRDWLHREHEYYAVIIDNYEKPRLFIGFNR